MRHGASDDEDMALLSGMGLGGVKFFEKRGEAGDCVVAKSMESGALVAIRPQPRYFERAYTP